MKILSRESFTTTAAALLTMSFVAVKAQDTGMPVQVDSMQNSTNDMVEPVQIKNDCAPVRK